MTGLYVHIPFCERKCGYCDFYSLKYDENTAKRYIKEVKRRIAALGITYDTVYFGGGTPSVIGSGVAEILSSVSVADNVEITSECNPNSANELFFESAAKAGVNRISIGLQSANSHELSFLTRTHTVSDVERAVTRARAVGIDNISLDVMLGYKGQTIGSLKTTLDFCIAQNVDHISAYMLKIEPATPFAKLQNIPLCDDETAALYEFCCDYLKSHGYDHYEISNFAKSGRECRHNLIYWNCDDYIGLGPAAHSLYKGKRLHFERDIESFLNGADPVSDGAGGGREEYIMLRLRLADGLVIKDLIKRGFQLPRGFDEKCHALQKNGLMKCENGAYKLTVKGFLVQNSVLSFLL